MRKFFGYTLLAVAAVAVIFYGAKTWLPLIQQRFSSLSISPPTETTPPKQQEATSTEPMLPRYIEMVNGCDWSFLGICTNMRSGPGTEYPVVRQLRNGMVLKVADMATATGDGLTWYKIGFEGQIRYPERLTEDWYVAATDHVRLFQNEGILITAAGVNVSSTKRIMIYRSTEMLYAYDGGTLFMKQPISAGLEFTPTPRGVFSVYKKMPTSYMQGPIPDISDQYYDLPGVPWDLYFTYQGGAIHGAYWHNSFGEPRSHGCVNLPPEQAHALYLWADLGTPVIVQD